MTTTKLLLADDSATVQRLIEKTFAPEQIQVITVRDGEKAIRVIPEERPDIVLADVAMPNKSGYAIAAFIKGRRDLAHIPVLLIASAFEPVNDVRAKECGCDGVLVGPLDSVQVSARVRKSLDDAKKKGRRPDLDDYFEKLDDRIAGRAGTLPAAHRAPGHDVRVERDPEEIAASVPTLDGLLGTARGDTLPAVPPGVSEAVIDEITRRVVERLSREAGLSIPSLVARVVSEIAEPLIREEMRRIRAGT